MSLRIGVMGTGYVGCTTAIALQHIGHQVVALDIDEKKIEKLNNYELPIYEPGLDTLLKSTFPLFTTDFARFLPHMDVIFIAVGTPMAEDGSANLEYVKNAAKTIAQNLSKDQFTIIVNKSTVPVGTGAMVESIIQTETGLMPDEDFAVISMPEYLREGSAVNDIFYFDRITVGLNDVNNQKIRKVIDEMLKPLVERTFDTSKFTFKYDPNYPLGEVHYVKRESSELIKYASNAFLTVKISFANELVRLAELTGANVMEIVDGMGMDRRIGRAFLNPSLGARGSCFPKDTSALVKTAQDYGLEMNIVKAAIDVNNKQYRLAIEKLQNKFRFLGGKKIAVLGLAFKANTDDARDTAAAFLIRDLLKLNATVSAYDPEATNSFKTFQKGVENVEYCNSIKEACVGAHAVIIVTDWQEFKTASWRKIEEYMVGNYFLDGRNMFDKEEMEKIGFEYEGLGI